MTAKTRSYTLLNIFHFDVFLEESLGAARGKESSGSRQKCENQAVRKLLSILTARGDHAWLADNEGTEDGRGPMKANSAVPRCAEVERRCKSISLKYGRKSN